MSLIKTTGIVLKEVNYKDNDKIITLLTPKLGVISCIARGARRINSPLLGSTQYLVYSDYVLYKGTGLYYINSTETINTFYNLKTDYDKLQYVFKISKIVLEFVQENQECEKILQLFLNTIYCIDKNFKEIEILTAIFKIKLCFLIGYEAKLKKCDICLKDIEENKQEEYTFDFSNCSIICRKCSIEDKKDKINKMKILDGTYNAIKYICISNIKKIFDFKVSERVKKQLIIFSDMYTRLIRNM